MYGHDLHQLSAQGWIWFQGEHSAAGEELVLQRNQCYVWPRVEESVGEKIHFFHSAEV